MEVKDIFKQAKRFGVCSMFTGCESKEELLTLFTTPQGLEFYQKSGFPSVEIIRQFKGQTAEQVGVYIDAGAIELHGAGNVVLVGDTQATLTYDDMASDYHQVTVMYGAKADVTASNWAVVFTNNLGGIIDKHCQDNAIIR